MCCSVLHPEERRRIQDVKRFSPMECIDLTDYMVYKIYEQILKKTELGRTE